VDSRRSLSAGRPKAAPGAKKERTTSAITHDRNVNPLAYYLARDWRKGVLPLDPARLLGGVAHALERVFGAIATLERKRIGLTSINDFGPLDGVVQVTRAPGHPWEHSLVRVLRDHAARIRRPAARFQEPPGWIAAKRTLYAQRTIGPTRPRHALRLRWSSGKKPSHLTTTHGEAVPHKQGYIKDVHVTEGQDVQEGEPLLTVETISSRRMAWTSTPRCLLRWFLSKTISPSRLNQNSIARHPSTAASRRSLKVSKQKFHICRHFKLQRVEVEQGFVASAANLQSKGYMADIEFKSRQLAVLEQQQKRTPPSMSF
jgi:hypothetical protein